MSGFEIAGRPVGRAHPPMVVAEIGINHEGSVDTARAMVKAAASAGGEVIKLQSHIVDDEMSDEACERIPGNADVSIMEIMRRCSLTEDEERNVIRYAESLGLIAISTPFSRAAIERLERIGVPAYKIGSGECSNYPLVRLIADCGKPVIMSTGMHTIEQVAPSVEILRQAGVPFALMHTTNLYPTPPSLVRLNAMQELAVAFPDAVIGLSDHSLTNYPCLGATALGASLLERHFTDSKERPGPDIVCSMDPEDLRELIVGSSIIHETMGGTKGPATEEGITMEFALASVVTIKPISVGEVFSHENIWVKRPAGGAFGPADFDGLLGRVCRVNVPGGKQLPATAV